MDIGGVNPVSRKCPETRININAHRIRKLVLDRVPVRSYRSVVHLAEDTNEMAGCGYQGRRIANDNYIQCRGVGCQLYVILHSSRDGHTERAIILRHFCFKCGKQIADGSNTSNVTSQVEEHYRNCTRYSKGDKCKVQ